MNIWNWLIVRSILKGKEPDIQVDYKLSSSFLNFPSAGIREHAAISSILDRYWESQFRPTFLYDKQLTDLATSTHQDFPLIDDLSSLSSSYFLMLY